MFEVPYVPGERPGGFLEVDTPLGEAVIYSFGAPGATDVDPTHLEACPMTYARYMLTSVLVLHLEAFGQWDDAIMRRIATGVAHFLLDTDDVTNSDQPFAAGVTGSDAVAGMPPTEYRSRNSLMDFILTPFAAYGVWDESGRIDDVTSQVYDAVEGDPEHPEQVFVPASMLFAATVAAQSE
ncbi:MAG: hypothetical protein H0X64_14640 [Gemmatimonadaceae bacterium]|nr:hypothetical protein [Gemmatimonadaceae bacterium]